MEVLEQFVQSVEADLARVCQYENKHIQLKALSLVPLSRIEKSTMRQFRQIQAIAVETKIPIGCEDSAYELIFIKEVMKWFKNEFFVWVNSPHCSTCNAETSFLGMSSQPQDTTLTKRVEVYKCTRHSCGKKVLFPRYNDVSILLESRRGRCGEWAQGFTLLCRALGWDARFISDNCDHVWTEVYSPFQKRWLHCDSCEGIIDKPLLYEKGWKKTLSYVMAFSCDGVYDVTWRYTSDHKAVAASRRLIDEANLIKLMTTLTERRRKEMGLTERRRNYVSKRHVCELVEFLIPVENRADQEYEGRTSGSLAWRLVRGEISAADLPTTSQYMWKPTNKEIAARRMVVRYLMHTDEYVNESGESILKGWQNGVFTNENIFKKEELDWKIMYLCRTEGSENGALVWKFDLSGSGLVVDLIRVRFQATTFSTGAVQLTLSAGDCCVTLNKTGGNQTSGPGFAVGILQETNELKGESVVTLRAQLSGGQGDVAWQHAQLFRVAMSNTSATSFLPMEVEIRLCEP